MQLKKSLPQDRTYDQILNHYKVEKAIAERIKKSNREERKQIYASMYEELFQKVPDHSRLTRRKDEEQSNKANKDKFLLIKSLINNKTVFAEFAPGDCQFSFEVANHVSQGFGIDISDQHNPSIIPPENFKLIVYDGYNLSEIPDNSIDVLFSDQLIEHFHPEETQLHFEIAYRILKKSGKYIFRTPHRYSGPHDISKYFSDEPEGFHLKEWTYSELKPVLRNAGFSLISARMMRKRVLLWLPFTYFEICEKVLGRYPRAKIRTIADLILHGIVIVANKN